jgi:peroxiredoxin
LREAYNEFVDRDAVLLTVSSTELEMTSFVAEALQAPYPVLSDADWSVFYRYGMGSIMGVPLHGVFIIDAAGIIRYSWVAPLAPVFTPPSAAVLCAELDALREQSKG